MLILILIAGGSVCGFGMLSVLSNERAARLKRIEDAIRAQAEQEHQQIEKAKEIPVVASLVPHAAIHEPQEEPIVVR
jgi:hypothetical protein